MNTNHEVHAKQNPEPYKGKVTSPQTPQVDGHTSSVAEAANYYNLPPILARFGDWAICEDGLHCLYVRYHVAKHRFDEPDWIEHVTEKPWVNNQDFISAFEEAKKMVTAGRI